MSNNVLNLKHKKVFGLLFLLGLITDVVVEILRTQYFNSKISGIEVLCLALCYCSRIAVVVCLLKSYNNTTNVLLSVSMIIAILATIFSFIEFNTVALSGIISIIFYAIVGVLLLSKTKNIKRITIIIIAYIFYLVIFVPIISAVQSYLIRYGNYGFWGQLIYVFNSIDLVCILLFLWSVLPVESNSSAKITVDTDVIDFKDLLQFIESEYHSGKITETEYQAKRTEIISKL